jgi:retron-type reverse transcriptase
MNLPGVGTEGVEQSFDQLGLAHWGKDGSIRTDVVLRNSKGIIIAIFDLKTGNAIIRPPRAVELRALTKAGPDVPIIELHSVRGPVNR